MVNKNKVDQASPALLLGCREMLLFRPRARSSSCLSFHIYTALVPAAVHLHTTP